jgi:hypothetical protein
MPTVTLRPTGNNGSSGFTLVGAASLQAALSDDSDASYARIAAGDWGTLGLALNSPSIPAGAMLRSVTPRARAKTVAGTSSLIVTPDLPGSFSTTSLAFGSSFTTVSAAPIAVSSLPSPMGMKAVGTFQPQTLDVAELYLDVLYASQPTTTVSAPSGTVTTTTQPQIAWLHTPGADGGGQSAWEVRVFNDAQYSATGFNPATSTPFWSASGSGSASSVVPAAQLVDDNYRVYVRTAQSVGGVNHWASYAFSAFTVSSTPPPAPTITATPDDALGRVRLVVTIDDTQASIARIEHSVDGGATWLPVRGGSRITVPGSTAILYDNEAPNGVTTLFRAQAIRESVNGDIASAWSTSASTSWASSLTWLKHLRNPNLSRTVRFHKMPEPTRDRRQGVFPVLGAEYPVVTQGRLQATAATAELLTVAGADADDLIALLATDTLLLQAPAPHRWGSRYIKPGRVTERRPIRLAGVGYRVWSFPYTEVAAPPDDGVEALAGLTWADIIDTYPTWQDLIDVVPEWGALF